jgi:S-adenosylmethionine synthetase
MELMVRASSAPPVARQPVEVVECKGLGHPDTICDALAEHISVRLSRHYLAQFGAVLHHNVDKILLCAGTARPAFGGGEVLEPIELFLGGRATAFVRGVQVPVHEIAVEACREWLARNLPNLEVERHVKIVPRMRAGSTELTGLFQRARSGPLANDSSCGVGFAPLSELERVVLTVARALNDPELKLGQPEIGQDIKVMGIRKGGAISLTIGCAFVGRHLRGMADYVAAKQVVCALATEAARREWSRDLDVEVNTADGPRPGDVFLTVTGTSAEAGDDGEVGRGNRVNGLITPYRPMTLEAAAGKNPVSHVGKLYNLVANRICAALVREVPQVREATCVLVSQIGKPVSEPQLADVQLTGELDGAVTWPEHVVRELVVAELGRIDELRQDLLEERVPLF